MKYMDAESQLKDSESRQLFTPIGTTYCDEYAVTRQLKEARAARIAAEKARKECEERLSTV